jgi:uncharacterized OB-fold protein
LYPSGGCIATAGYAVHPFFVSLRGRKMTNNWRRHMPDTPSKERYIDNRWFKDFGNGPALAGTRCTHCKKVFFPPKPVCPVCFDGVLEEVPLSRKGTIHTVTQSIMGPADMEKPYIMGLVDLPEGIKLFTLITGSRYGDEDIRIGAPVEMVIGKIKRDEEGYDVISYSFRPAGKEDKQ